MTPHIFFCPVRKKLFLQVDSKETAVHITPAAADRLSHELFDAYVAERRHRFQSAGWPWGPVKNPAAVASARKAVTSKLNGAKGGLPRKQS